MGGGEEGGGKEEGGERGREARKIQGRDTRLKNRTDVVWRVTHNGIPFPPLKLAAVLYGYALARRSPPPQWRVRDVHDDQFGARKLQRHGEIGGHVHPLAVATNDHRIQIRPDDERGAEEGRRQ